MKIYEIPENANLTLCFKLKDKTFEKEIFIYAKKDDTIYIPAICLKGEPLPGSSLKHIKLVYTTDNGIFTFININLKLVSSKGTNLYAVKCIIDAKRVNRRDAYRLFLGDTFKIRIIDNNGKYASDEGIVRDVSALGLGLILNKKIENAASFEILFNQYAGYRTTILCTIIRSLELDNNKGYLYGCKITQENKILSKFILDRQLLNSSKSRKFL